MAPKKKTTAKKKPAKKKPAKKPVKQSVFRVRISRTLYTFADVQADCPEAAEQMVWDNGDAHNWWDDRAEWGDFEVECDGEEIDVEPDIGDDEDEGEEPDAAEEEEEPAECIGEETDEAPSELVADEDEGEDPVAAEEEEESAEEPEVEAAPAKKKFAKKKSTKKKARAVDPAVVEGIIASMVPIPGKDYRMGKFPVTQAQWEAVMGENPSDFEGADNPVENVSWDDCQAFLETLNAQPAAKASGLVFRLPEEDEWETACRAGATGDYCKLADGTEITEETLGEVAWFDDNSDLETHPVGQKKPNAFGLYDMHGNVWEWTATADGVYRVNRGGSWFDSARDCGSSNRNRISPFDRYDFLGFRLCASGRAD